MKVILTQDVKAQGKKGDVIQVSDGYATNYLFKNKLAVPANAQNISINNAQKRAAEAKRAEELAKAKQIAAKLKDVTITFTGKVSENGKMFGSVTNKEIAEELEKQGYSIDKKKIELPQAIKSAGTYKVHIKLYAEVTANIFVVVK